MIRSPKTMAALRVAIEAARQGSFDDVTERLEAVAELLRQPPGQLATQPGP